MVNSAGSFSHFDDMKPKVVKVDFPEIKTTDEKARAEALRDAGMSSSII